MALAVKISQLMNLSVLDVFFVVLTPRHFSVALRSVSLDLPTSDVLILFASISDTFLKRNFGHFRGVICRWFSFYWSVPDGP